MNHPKREWRFSIWHLFVLTAIAGVFFWFVRSVEPPLVAGTLIGGGLGAFLDAIFRRRTTSIFLGALLVAIAAAFIVVAM